MKGVASQPHAVISMFALQPTFLKAYWILSLHSYYTGTYTRKNIWILEGLKLVMQETKQYYIY